MKRSQDVLKKKKRCFRKYHWTPPSLTEWLVVWKCGFRSESAKTLEYSASSNVNVQRQGCFLYKHPIIMCVPCSRIRLVWFVTWLPEGIEWKSLLTRWQGHRKTDAVLHRIIIMNIYTMIILWYWQWPRQRFKPLSTLIRILYVCVCVFVNVWVKRGLSENLCMHVCVCVCLYVIICACVCM